MYNRLSGWNSPKVQGLVPRDPWHLLGSSNVQMPVPRSSGVQSTLLPGNKVDSNNRFEEQMGGHPIRGLRVSFYYRNRVAYLVLYGEQVPKYKASAGLYFRNRGSCQTRHCWKTTCRVRVCNGRASFRLVLGRALPVVAAGPAGERIKSRHLESPAGVWGV